MTTAKAALLSLLLAAPAAAQKVPPAPGGRPAEYEGALRAFWSAGRWEPMGELTGALRQEARREERTLMLGAYHRTVPALKLGAFLRLESGVRQDDDWDNPGRGVWLWRMVDDRTQPVAVLDATPRAELPLPGGGWVAAFKVRGEQNLGNGHRLVRLEPELRKFLLEGTRPWASVSLRAEADLATNFGERAVSGKWLYLSALRHLPSGLSVGPHAALGEGVFSTSTAFKSAGGSSYAVVWKAFVLGIDAVCRFGEP